MAFGSTSFQSQVRQGRTATQTAADDQAEGVSLYEAQYLVIAMNGAHPLVAPLRLHLDVPMVVIGRGVRRHGRRSGDDCLHIELADNCISSRHARLVRERAQSSGWTIEDAGSKNGTFLNGVRVLQATRLNDGDVIALGNSMIVFRALSHTGSPRDDLASLVSGSALPSTLHPPWASQLSTMLRVGRSQAPVLLLGATGTGKEVLARAVHAASGRSGAFVPVNCGAIARTLVESELFGARKGAFSGALEDCPGLVRAADGGTLFLDEIAELPEPAQVALLRVLQESAVLPVGATRALPIDLRVVAATNEDLAARVAAGRFRADLYARIAGHVVHLPSLQERREDIGLLIAELLPRLAAERSSTVTFTRAASRALFAHAWPYNVRELEQALTVALAIAPDAQIDLHHLPAHLNACSQTPTSDMPQPALESSHALHDESRERQRIVDALAACAGNQTRAAKELGISRATLVNKLAIHRVERPRKAAR